MYRTKIIATIGPASLNEEVLRAMKAAGMGMARINTAHGDLTQYTGIVKTLRQIGGIPIMIDLKGPEIRLITDQDYVTQVGAKIVVGCQALKHYAVSLTHNVCPLVKIGTVVLFDGGAIKGRVTRVANSEIELEIEIAGTIKNHKGVNIPEVVLPFDFVPDLDKKLLHWSAEQGIEYVALSFVRTAADIETVRRLIRPEVKLIAKLETRQALKNLDEIIKASDGVMVARGDLGVEMPIEELPLLQHEILHKTNALKKMDIVATQMLLSMVEAPKPTRAEVSDVAHAVWQGADYLMLSEETAQGKYPVEAVSMMHKIITQAEHGLETHEIAPEA